MTETGLVLDGAHVVCPQSGRDEVVSVRIADGKISALGEAATDDVVVDCRGLQLTPGLFCPAVLLSDPGHEDEETLAQTLNRAAAGGFTDVVGLPAATSPRASTAPAVDALVARAVMHRGAHLHVAGALMRGADHDGLSEMGQMQAAGVVCVADAPSPQTPRSLMRRALDYAAGFNLPVVLGARDSDFAANGVATESPRACRLGLPVQPACAEDRFVADAIAWCRLTGSRVHLVGISTAASARLIEKAQAEGLPLTGACSIYHLVLDETLFDSRPFDARLLLTPPLRIAEDRQAMREAVNAGTLTLCTLHKGQNAANVDVEFALASPAAPVLPAAFGLARACLDAQAAVRAFTAARNSFGLEPAAIVPGAPANIALFGDVTADERSHRETDGMRHSPVEDNLMTHEAMLTLRSGACIHISDAAPPAVRAQWAAAHLPPLARSR